MRLVVDCFTKVLTPKRVAGIPELLAREALRRVLLGLLMTLGSSSGTRFDSVRVHFVRRGR